MRFKKTQLFRETGRRRKMTDLAQLDAVALSRAIRSRSISPVEVVDAALARIDELNCKLLAYCTPTAELARTHARDIGRRLAAGERVGVLAGVPISIKDLIFTRGVLTTGGAVAYADFVPDEDDIVVERLWAADAIMLGKTNVAELGYSLTGDNPLFGTTRNPWDLRRTSGGSSAGAAVAVATGMGPIAIGSDGGGSIRVPAAFCGVFGFKPSMGCVPLYPGCRDERYPGLSGWETLEHIGPLTRTVADAALVLSVIAGPDPRDRRSIPDADGKWLTALETEITGRRVAYCRTWGGVTVDPEILAATDAAAKIFDDELGCHVEEVMLDWPNPVLKFRQLMILDTDLAAMRSMVDSHEAKMSPHLVKMMRSDWPAETLTDAITERKAVANRMWRLMKEFDFLLTPATTGFPPLADRQDTAADIERPLPVFSCVANMTGQPAASLPIGHGASGLPIGLQIMGRHLADRDVLAASAAFEKCRPWHARWPAL
jgi:aspartyl-tRNA(Asn)/glutamyl-tRNA(Gln) amidotransferase subunit A